MKLLNKSLRLYLLYAVALLLIAIPLFYFAIQSIVSEDVDENLAAQEKELASKLEKQSTTYMKIFPEIVSSDFELSTLQDWKQKSDTFYTIQQYDSLSEESLPYRVLESNMLIKKHPYRLKLKSSLIDTEDLKERIVLIVGILLLCFITGLYLINIYISKRTWKPFYQTLEKLHLFRVDKNEPIQLPVTNVSEFADLNKTIINLTNTNQQVYQSQKGFTENASHEMQTPIAVLQSKMELLMQTVPLTAEQAELITDAAQTGQWISKLNKALLLLVKIDNNQFPEKEDIILNATVESILQQYKNAIAEKNLTVESDIINVSFIVANKLLIEILISNLLSNAIRHNQKNGEIKITVANNNLTIINTGSLKALDTSKLFKRFYKQTTDNQSLGLGLALVHRICNLYVATISYTFLQGRHVFSVDFNNPSSS